MMPEQPLSPDDRTYLLRVARQAIAAGLEGRTLPTLDTNGLTQALLQNGASFVTLTIDDYLRGCIGALEAYQPLVYDVQEHAAAAAFEDYRFPPLQKHEFERLHIEISRLTNPVPLEYEDATDLLNKLHPDEDGVILRDGRNRATFLPQVWEKVPEKEAFLSQLCQKMGANPDTWRRKHLAVAIYHVEEFHEEW
jgi:AmmeMemoRadiSam system protein A